GPRLPPASTPPASVLADGATPDVALAAITRRARNAPDPDKLPCAVTAATSRWLRACTHFNRRISRIRRIDSRTAGIAAPPWEAAADAKSDRPAPLSLQSPPGGDVR